jgi:hypothetical protein
MKSLLNEDLFTFFNINNLKKYSRYTKFLNAVEIYNSIDIENLLPEYVLNEYNVEYDNALEKLSELDSVKYSDRYLKYQALFASLTNAKINLLVYKSFLDIEKNETIKSCLRSFKPTKGYSDIVSYNACKTSTGRLVVDRGPKILTLPKRCRGILQSSFENGRVISVDFNALEPRLFLKFNNEKCDGDIYEEISNRLEFQIDRSVIKRAIISILYGTSVNNLQNISDARKEEIYSTVINYFGYNNLLEKASNINENDLRLNFFGRPINNLEEDKKHIIINNYVQSTAVDISLSYFTELTNALDTQKAKPLFIIHDAIVFDVAAEYHNKFVEIIEQGYNDKDLGHFPVAIEDFN